MNNIDMAYGLIFKSLSLNQEVPSIIQRKIYLLQSLGTDLGLHFVFFQRGPYSSELSDYLNSSLGIISSLSFFISASFFVILLSNFSVESVTSVMSST